ncbi:hypothetical protein MJO28_007997 [Puccinia striiformis f. sp. tritici]|uniref:Uncharacterized protein n=1 Tax=Puccinia striiformis f. sp. tritici TaxID=168172 RepID=A0ACC0EBF9_9BASI|nr:hypothetical protein MJO28_007997 [Puccinia striiformis f. sp. tritici]
MTQEDAGERVDVSRSMNFIIPRKWTSGHSRYETLLQLGARRCIHQDAGPELPGYSIIRVYRDRANN